GWEVRQAVDAAEAQAVVRSGFAPEVVLLDIQLPGMSGVQLLEWLRREAELAQVVMSTGVQDLETVRFCLREGAYDYLLKPFDPDELAQAIDKALERGRQVRSFRHRRQELETTVVERTRELESARDMALLGMARLAESRDRETGAHLERIAEYAAVLGEALRAGPYAGRIDGELLTRLRKSAPLHDIGKVGVPDAVLLKEGPLSPDERRIMESHTRIGGDTLRSVGAGSPDPTFLEMAIEIAYQHHERWDGSGYPHRLSGEEISLPARIAALADAYDAITTARPYKPAFGHKEAVRRIVADRGKHFDPVLVDAFLACHRDFDRIRHRLANGS
ncbi:MAG TPA: HD domain-containing phosphohydrolase, partial [Thermoanaerobaculia bacterium]|nr:HD domain-containing phosphohydrolase [Thermoanaerobaculia bacterium]